MVSEYKYNTNCLYGQIKFKRLACIRRKRENKVVRRTPREREKDPMPAIVHSLARLRPSNSKHRKKLLGHVSTTQIDETAPGFGILSSGLFGTVDSLHLRKTLNTLHKSYYLNNSETTRLE